LCGTGWSPGCSWPVPATAGTPTRQATTDGALDSFGNGPVAVAVLATDQRRGVGVVENLLSLRVETQGAADPRRDVRQVDQGRRQMPRHHVGVERLLVAADAGEEVRVVGDQIGLAGPLPDQLVARAVQLPA